MEIGMGLLAQRGIGQGVNREGPPALNEQARVPVMADSFPPSPAHRYKHRITSRLLRILYI